MRIFFAGADNTTRYNNILLKAGVENRLESFYSLNKKRGSVEFKNYLLDSGGFVARTKNIIISVQEYAAYINRYGIKQAFNLDTNDTKATLENQKYLEKHTNAYILPIYHASDWTSGDLLIDKFIADGYPYIALGGMAGVTNSRVAEQQFLAHCFKRTRDKVKVHGLGKTAIPTLERFPFYSVDSTSWLSFARYGNSLSDDNLMTQMKAKRKHYLPNTYEEIIRWKQVEREINQLWERRGIVWKD